jgi:predicted nucleic acid-binding protein
VTVIDTSAMVDYLLGGRCEPDVTAILVEEGIASAPDILVFETLAVLRRNVLRGDLDAGRASAAVYDFGDAAIELIPTHPLRLRAWELRDNLTIGDAFFVTLAEQLGEPLATTDARLAAAARRHTGIDVIVLAA